MCLCLAKVQLWTPYSNFPNSADQSEMFSNLLLVLRASREAGWAVVASLSSLAFSASLKGNGFNLRYLDWIYRCLWEVRKERHKAYELAGFNNYMGPAYFWVHVWEKEWESRLWGIGALCIGFCACHSLLGRFCGDVYQQSVISGLSVFCVQQLLVMEWSKFCEDLGGHTQAEAAECNARLSCQCLMAAADIAFKQ